MRLLNEPENRALASRLGMGPEHVKPLQGLPPDQVQARFKAMQDAVPKLFKTLALEMHPDRNLDDPEATKNFQRLSAVKDALMLLRVQIRQPQPVRRVIIVQQGFGGFSANTTTSSTTGGFGWNTTGPSWRR